MLLGQNRYLIRLDDVVEMLEDMLDARWIPPAEYGLDGGRTGNADERL